MYCILSVIFFIAAMFAMSNIEHLIGLSIISALFSIADSIDDHKKVLEDVKSNIFKLKEEISKK